MNKCMSDRTLKSEGHQLSYNAAKHLQQKKQQCKLKYNVEETRRILSTSSVIQPCCLPIVCFSSTLYESRAYDVLPVLFSNLPDNSAAYFSCVSDRTEPVCTRGNFFLLGDSNQRESRDPEPKHTALVH